MTLTQRIAALIGGVSQRPQSQRESGDADAQTNALNRPAFGLMKRPPLAHFAKVSSDVTGLDQGFVHSIELSAVERFLAVVRNGAISVFDKLTGAPMDVSVLNADGYLTPITEDVIPADDLMIDTDGTFLNQHTIAATGGLWDQWLGVGFNSTIVAFKAKFKRDGFGTSESYLWPDAPPTADYTVEATCLLDGGANSFVGVVGRAVKGVGGYVATIRTGSNEIRLSTLDTTGARLSSLATDTSGTLNAGTPYRLKMVMAGTSIKVFLDGVQKLNVVNGAFAAVGKGGIYGDGSQTFGLYTYIDSFRMSYTPAVVAGPPPLKAAQVGKQTVVANTSVTVQRGTTSAPNRAYKALIAIRQADYGTQYAITIDNQKLAFGSPEGVTAQSRIEIDTTVMAKRLKDLIDGNNTLDAFLITQFGSTLLVERTDTQDFSIAADDGLADNGLSVIKGSVQRFTDLPEKAPSGFTVEVTGDVSNQFDNYFVTFDVTNTATNVGVWRECVKPGEPISLKASTMPHVLTYKGSFIPPSTGNGAPPLPTIAPGGGTLVKDRWDASAALSNRLLLTTHNQNYDATLDGANGIQTEYTVYYDVDTRLMDANSLANVVLYAETAVGSGVYTEATRKRYGSELVQNSQTLSAVLTLAANQKIRLQLEYADNVSPVASKRATIYTAAFNTAAAVVGAPKDATAIIYYARTGKLVTFLPTQVYPQGATIRIQLDVTNNFDYTPLTDLTGTAVAAALQTLIDASATYVATTPAVGQILVTRTDATNFTATAFSLVWNEATRYHDPALAMTPSSLVGKTIKNLTDGSTGDVFDNTATTILVSSMSGGSDNLFQKGDKIEVLGSGRYFTFGVAPWVNRAAGDLITNPMPSLVDQKINDLFITKGRLGFLAGGNAVLSEAGNLFNVFRTTVTQLLDSDPIDIKPAHSEAVRFHSYSAWDGRDILWSARHQFEMSGEPLLSPKTVKLLPISEYPMDAIRPVVLGRHAYFVAKRQGFTQVWALGISPATHQPDAIQMTADQSQYIAGNTLVIAGDEDLGVFAVLTDADRSQLYVHTYDRDLEQYAWTLWQFPAGTSLFGLSFKDGVLTALSKRSDGAYLDTLDIDARSTIGLLDRRHSSVGVFSAGSTTWTLPFSCATNGSEGTIVVQNASTGALLTTSRPSATTVAAVGDFSAITVYIGITYTFSHTLSTLFQRVPAGGNKERVILNGRLQLSRLKVHYEDSRNFTVTVTPLSRTARAYSLAATVDTDGTLSVPVLCRNTDVSIVITNATPTACRITDLEWEGNHYSRSRS